MAWLRLIFETDAEGAPSLSDWLSEAGAAAVTLGDSADQPLFEPPPGATPLWNRTRVVGLFPAEAGLEAVVGQLARRSAPEPLPPYQVEALAYQDWTRAWMDSFEPMRFGRRLWIVPSWCQPPEPNAVNILLDPGLAFGTGTHPTTRLCLEWLDGHEIEGKTGATIGSLMKKAEAGIEADTIQKVGQLAGDDGIAKGQHRVCRIARWPLAASIKSPGGRQQF